MAGREPHDLARRAHLHLQAAPGRQVPRRHRDHRGRRASTAPSASSPEEGRRRRSSRTMVAPGSDQGGRQVHRRVHAHQAVGHLHGRDARDPRGQRRPPQEEREGRRLGRGLAHEQRRGLGLLHAHALRPRRRLHRQALPRPLHAVGAEVHRRDRVPARQGRQHARARHDQGRLPGHRRLPAQRPGQAPARGAERQDRRAGVDAHHDVPDQQPARAAQRRARAPRHQLRVRLRRVQQGHPGRLGRAQPGADPQQPVGRAARREGLQLRPRQGQAGAEPGRGQGRPPAHRRLSCRGSARPSRRPP